MNPENYHIRLSIDGHIATPILTEMIAKVLQDAGAEIQWDGRALPTEAKSLQGLTIHIGQLTWVRDEEVMRWGKTKEELEIGYKTFVNELKKDKWKMKS